MTFAFGAGLKWPFMEQVACRFTRPMFAEKQLPVVSDDDERR